MAKSKARTFGQDMMRGEHVGSFPAYRAKQGARKDGVTIDSEGEAPPPQSGTSIFDPVLCELSYRWFCPPDGRVLDPFAGGSVRGIVASKLGRHYLGIDLRPEQIDANREQATAICDKACVPLWHTGDSFSVLKTLGDARFDFIFSCPPYADLEVYSDDPRDLSTMAYEDFRSAYANIIAASCARLKDDRFATFVVGDLRDKTGCYRNFPGHTIVAFEAAGLRLYNEAILITAAGSLPIRVGKQFTATRKLGKTHQNVLTFIKGDPRKATEAIGEVEFGAIEGMEDHQPSEGGKAKAGDKYGELL